MLPFQIGRADGRPDWQVILQDFLVESPYGTLLKTEDMIAALQRGVSRTITAHTAQAAMRRASRESLKFHSKIVEPVIGVGYRIVQPNEHKKLKLKKDRKAHRSLEYGRDIDFYTDVSALTPEEQKAREERLMNTSQVLSMTQAQIRDNERRARVLDKLRKGSSAGAA